MKSIVVLALILFCIMPAYAAPVLVTVTPLGRSSENVAALRQNMQPVAASSTVQELAVITRDCAENFTDNMAKAEMRLLRDTAGQLGRTLGGAVR